MKNSGTGNPLDKSSDAWGVLVMTQVGRLQPLHVSVVVSEVFMPSALVFSALLGLGLPPAADRPELPAKVVLGGPRKVEVQIDRDRANWSIKVRMRPVRAFDDATNARLNREKARQFALQALARVLSDRDSAEFAVSGVAMGESGEDGAYFTLAVTVPKDRVSVVETGRQPKTALPAVERISHSSALFTRKADLERTTALVAEILLGDVGRLQTVKGAAFDRGIAAVEERADATFAALADEIANEKLLLQIEAKELREGVAAAKSRLFDAMKAAVARREPELKPVEPPAAVKKAFRDISVEPPFDAVLFGNVLLMETTGAKVIRLPDGRRMIVAVGSTVVKDDSAKERLRAEVVCRTKALASVVAEKNGVQVVRVERIEETTVVKIEDGKETATSVSDFLQLTRAKVEGVAKGMPLVGRWNSKDGTVCYFAFGAILDANERSTPSPR